ncbi:hypothetical protein EU642_22350 [Salmonella enterica]|nr:hypothetical protein [Salmonella enterica]EAO0118596.1 hypothetical protein [Salmonella enterica]EAO3601699.1 hypothetical protein [Salmonella enterica]EAR6391594.1 hypothetical protein [Salmonella enterica]EAV1285358.1 hypothetical protein [Salmonella enterica]
MLFKWEYSDSPTYRGMDSLMLGVVHIGHIEHRPNGEWRAVCYLPDSGDFGLHQFIDDFRAQGLAKDALEKVCAKWINKSGIWHV